MEVSDAESYYFVGKDNIPFHTVIWPAMLMGYGGLNLPTDVPANQYITFKGRRRRSPMGSAGRSGGTPSASSPMPCVTRSPRCSPSKRHRPERRRHDSEDQRRAGGHLGQPRQSGPLVERSDFDGKVPEPGQLTPPTRRWSHRSTRCWRPWPATSRPSSYGFAGGHGRRLGGERLPQLRRAWHVVKEDPERAGTILWTAIQAISGIRVALTPYLPWTSGRLGEMLGIGPKCERMGTTRRGRRHRVGDGHDALHQIGRRRPRLNSP